MIGTFVKRLEEGASDIWLEEGVSGTEESASGTEEGAYGTVWCGERPAV